MGKKIIHILFSLVISGLFVNVTGQADNDSLILYTPEFKFKEGVYPDFISVKRNNPIPKSRIISDYSYSDKKFFDRVLGQNKITYYDNLGNQLHLKTSGLWGYSRNGFLHVNIDNGFYRITLIGSICHFIAYRTYENYNSANNYYNNNYYYNNYPYSNRPTSSTTEMQQYILDFKTGRIMDYSVAGMEVVLMSDPKLHDEYMGLSKKKKKQLKFVFIRRFNERNPLYLIKK